MRMSSFDLAKKSQGFVTATMRPACRNCKHGDQQFQDRMPPYDTSGWRCLRAGFFTTALAICDKHEPTAAFAQRLQAQATGLRPQERGTHA